MSLRLAVFASGGGSNLQALLDRFNRPSAADSPIRVVLVVSDRENAGALDRARADGVDAVVIPVAGRPMDFVARELLGSIESADVDLIALAGYLRLVPPAVVRTFRNRIVNIHPALLPAFGGQGMFGLRVHRAVLESGATVTGPTVHLVDEAYDRGRIIAQWPVPVLAADTPESLAARVLRVEHRLYPAAIEALARTLTVGAPVHRFGPQSAAAFHLSTELTPSEGDVRRALGLED
ncbi:MAG TPA: phosphoribosylglycinamide formyltransferase [Longimicrobiales bacterium]|nr:phosphoribosylglycinamide formyltransferase [Longimicrobiales bacterium]